MSFLNKLYPHLPVWIQNIGISMYGYRWKKRRFGGVYKSELLKFKHREGYDSKQWGDYQEEKLREILNHAINFVPYYRESLSKFKDDIAKFTINDLSRLPYLEKNNLRIHGKTKLISEKLEDNGEYYSSSGSTGTPTQILFSAAMHQRWSAAFEARIRNWAGLTIKDARGMIGGRRILRTSELVPPFYRYNVFEKQVYFSAYHIAPSTVANYVDGMRKHNIKYLTGYAQSNYILARYIEQLNIKAPKLSAVITSSEKMTPEMKATLSRVYNCKVYDSYSGVEACGLISECEHGKLHISPDVAVIEVIKEDGTYAKPGESGEAICTGFLNYDQPLIRYRIGDVLTLDENQTCHCGRNMPIVSEIVGRLEDTVIGTDGRAMVRFHGLFINIPKIIESQIVQLTSNEFEINIVADSALTENDKEIIMSRLESQMGEVHVKFKQVDKLPRDKNGKIKAVISHLGKND